MKFNPVDSSMFKDLSLKDFPVEVTPKLAPNEIQEGWRYKHRTRDILVRVKKYDRFSGKQFVSFDVLRYDDPDKDIAELPTVLSYSEFAVLFGSTRKKITLNPDELYAGIIPWKDVGLYLTHLPPFYRAILHDEGGGPWTLGYTDEHGFFVKFSAMGTGHGISNIQNFPPDKYDVEFSRNVPWLADWELELDECGNFKPYHDPDAGTKIVTGQLEEILHKRYEEDEENQEWIDEQELGSRIHSLVIEAKEKALSPETEEDRFLDAVITIPQQVLKETGAEDVKFKCTKVGDRMWKFSFTFNAPEGFWDRVRQG